MYCTYSTHRNASYVTCILYIYCMYVVKCHVSNGEVWKGIAVYVMYAIYVHVRTVCNACELHT